MEGVGDVWIEKLADDGVLQAPQRLLRADRRAAASATSGWARSARAQHGRLDRGAPRASGLRRALIGLAIPMASDGTAKRLCLAGYERIEDVAGRDRSRTSWRSATSARRSPRARRVLRARRGRARRSRRCARTASYLDVLDEDRPVDVAAAADSPLKGATVVDHRRVHRPAVTARRSAARTSRASSSRPAATAASSVSANTDDLLAGAERRRVEDRPRPTSSASTSSTRTSSGRWLADAGVT